MAKRDKWLRGTGQIRLAGFAAKGGRTHGRNNSSPFFDLSLLALSRIKLSIGRIAQADLVLEHAPTWSIGSSRAPWPSMMLTRQLSSLRKRRSLTRQKMARLRDEAPDLADQVAEERISVAEAYAGPEGA